MAIVTGKGRGIGEAIAMGLARGGANLVLTSRTRTELDSVAKKVENIGSRALVQECDVSQDNAVQELMAKSVN
jgi:short-subunit dehydrogenase